MFIIYVIRSIKKRKHFYTERDASIIYIKIVLFLKIRTNIEIYIFIVRFFIVCLYILKNHRSNFLLIYDSNVS